MKRQNLKGGHNCELWGMGNMITVYDYQDGSDGFFGVGIVCHVRFFLLHLDLGGNHLYSTGSTR
jgi:hypothetical protein